MRQDFSKYKYLIGIFFEAMTRGGDGARPGPAQCVAVRWVVEGDTYHVNEANVRNHRCTLYYLLVKNQESTSKRRSLQRYKRSNGTTYNGRLQIKQRSPLWKTKQR